jgi:hypothetical protein
MLKEKSILKLLKTQKSNLLPYALLPLFIVFLFSGCDSKIKKNLVTSVCEHYNCADATVLQVTDQYFPPYSSNVRNNSSKYGAIWAEFLAFKYDIPLHVFEQNIKGNGFKAFLQTGRGGASVYYPSCFEPYRITKLDSILIEIGKAYGRKPTTISYGCDKTTYADSLPLYILGGRNSLFFSAELGMNSITWYGPGAGIKYQKDFSKREIILSRSAGGRFYTDIQRDDVSVLEAQNFVQEQVGKTIKTHGFYTNFMH